MAGQRKNAIDVGELDRRTWPRNCEERRECCQRDSLFENRIAGESIVVNHGLTFTRAAAINVTFHFSSDPIFLH